MGSEDFESNWGWSIVVAGLDERGAERLVEVASGVDEVLVAEAIDPRQWLTMNWDRSTAEDVWRRLGACPPDHGGSDNLRDGIREWLDATDEQSPASMSVDEIS